MLCVCVVWALPYLPELWHTTHAALSLFFAAFSDIIKTMKIDFNPAVIVNGSERIVLEKLKYYHEPNNE